ncbi:UbiE family methyltransferase [Phellopilus nigrolimitatus]|nr:UbiE family methyltransferase [Phellopilus nigrolimitatus]
MSSKPVVYIHGHASSVLRSHSSRTAANSAAYLLDSLKPDMHILDVGCGPGTITIDLAKRVPKGQVVGLEPGPDVLGQARANAAEHGVDNVKFDVGNVQALAYLDNTFDVVHAHQVLQYVGDPIQALREMRRVTKPGGIVAVREADFSTMAWYPELEGLSEWEELYRRVARGNGGEPNAGRRLHAWARQAGFTRDSITASSSNWCYSTAEEVAWWSSLWADRTIDSSFTRNAIDGGLADKDKLDYISEVFRKWGAQEDAWFVLVHGEILCRV